MPRHLYIQNASKISFENNSIVVQRTKDDNGLSFPLEDLDLVFLEDYKTNITSALLAEMGNRGVSLVVCGKDFLPAAQSSPVNGHYLQSAIMKLQLEQLPYKKKKYWEFVVKQKIANQIAVLQATNDDNEAITRLQNYQEQVRPGDETNMEGIAARVYFSSLFGKDFIRFSQSPLSSALNYGYSILASCVIRQVSVSGLVDNIGVWHNAAANANNLSYDLIEPFRQMVDYYVYCHQKEVTLPLNKNLKLGLISLLNEQIKISGLECKTAYAVELMVEAYVNYLKTGKTESIKLPAYQPGLAVETEEEQNG